MLVHEKSKSKRYWRRLAIRRRKTIRRVRDAQEQVTYDKNLAEGELEKEKFINGALQYEIDELRAKLASYEQREESDWDI